MKISEAFDAYERQEVLAMNYSPCTFKSYQNAGKKAVLFFGNRDISSINIADTHEFYLDMIKTCCSDTARSYLSKLRNVLRWCSTQGDNVINADLIKLPRSEKKVARFLTLEEYADVVEEVSRPRRGYKSIDRVRNTLIVEMLFSTGLRVSELCALNRDSISNRQFVVVGKSKEPRVCFITRRIESKIKAYLDMRIDHNRALFVDTNGNRVTAHNIQSVFRRISKNSGVFACTPHTLRHSFATYMIEDGVDIRYVAAMLGHQSLQTTQKYTHVRDKILHQIYDGSMSKFAQKTCGKLGIVS